MFLLTKDDGLEPCPYCGSTKARVARSLQNPRNKLSEISIGSDGLLITRHTVIYGFCVCHKCCAQSPRISVHLPDEQSDRLTFRDRSETRQEYIDALVEMWNFRHPRDGVLKRIVFRPRDTEENSNG